MTKINFKNYPNTTTPISAENLNQMQANIENDINSKVKTFKLEVLDMTHNFTFSDNGNGQLYYSLEDLYKKNLTKKEIGYTTSNSTTTTPTYKVVTSISGSVATGINNTTVYVWVRLTYSDLGVVTINTDKFGNRYNLYMGNSGGLACFTGNTEILTSNGLKTVKEIELNEEVLTLQGYKKVIKKYEHITDKIYNITVNDKVVECSYSHPFITDKGIVIAKDLQVGDVVCNINKEKLKITNINVEEKETKVFEINTDTDNYYITDKNILVASEKLL